MATAQTSPSRTAGVKIEHASRRYGAVWAVKDVSLDVAQGELFGLLGPNGAGKTTLFSMLSTQIKPTSGELWVQGVNVRTSPKRVRSLVGIVPQTPAAYEKLSAWENLLLFAELHKVGPAEAHKRASELLRMVGLTERRHDAVSTYSGGMKHRLNIILGLVHDPAVVFFDEPTTGLDPIARKGLWDIIRLLQRAGKTIILTTHYMDEAERLCDRVAILNRGRIVAEGSPKKMGNSLEEIFFQCTTADDPKAKRTTA